MQDRHLRDKARLRTELRRRRRALSDTDQAAASEAVTRHITGLPGWLTARRIALYLARDGELDPTPLGTLCRDTGMQVFLPVIDDQDLLRFAEWQKDGQLIANRYGIPEPATDSPRCHAAQLDIVVLPLVGWDLQGGRLGMGGGFYDRALAGVSGTLLVGLAHSVQQVPRVPRDDWDLPLDFVVTETALHCCQGNH